MFRERQDGIHILSHQAKLPSEAAGMVLPDVLAPDLKVVFCGTAVGRASARTGAYYAGPGNKFWPMIHEIGLTTRVLRPEEFQTLPSFGVGLTDLAKFVAGSDADVGEGHWDVIALERKIKRSRPKAVAFNGKKAASVFLGCDTRAVEYGRQCKTVGGVPTFVLPSTSGSANGYWDSRYWHELAQFVLG